MPRRNGQAMNGLGFLLWVFTFAAIFTAYAVERGKP